MPIISTSEFRANSKKYYDMAFHEQVIIRRGKEQTFILMPTHCDVSFEITPELEAKLEKARQDIQAGHGVSLHNHEEIDHFFAQL